MKEFDVAIIGAGAAGLMCAIQSGLRGRTTILLDHSERIGRKILISGGGRCNFTNLYSNATCFISRNPHFAKSALSIYTPQHFIELVNKHRIPFHEKKLGQLFCDVSAQSILDMLVRECEEVGAVFQLGCHVTSVSKNGKFVILSDKESVSAERIVIATGGLSIPQIGATGFGYEIARQFGLSIIEPAPALDGFQLRSKDLSRFAILSGVSIDTTVSCGQASFRENILFTHQGLSGPASLQASLYWSNEMPISINLLPDLAIFDWLTEERASSGRVDIKNVLAERLPKRFASMFCEILRLNGPTAEVSDKDLLRLSEALARWQLRPEGTIGYKKAEVTRGGVDTQELSSKTMESKRVPGLFFIGEVVDVTGQLGGHNFQWAWASGFAAGTNV
jgi:predicted Rossmann fold flavoprotein